MSGRYGQYLNDALSTDNNERSYDVVWAAFLENSFISSEWRITRGESHSESIKHLLNESRSSTDAKIRGGPKFDGRIIPKEKGTDAVGRELEFGFVEVARKRQKSYMSKYIDDSQKMLKAMRASFLVWRGPDIRVSVLTCGMYGLYLGFPTGRLGAVLIGGVGNELSIIILKRHPGGLYVSRFRDAVTLPLRYNGEAVAKVVREIAFLQRLVGLWKIEGMPTAEPE